MQYTIFTKLLRKFFKTDSVELDEQQKRTLENGKIVGDAIEKLWNGLQDATKNFDERRRYIIFNRVTGYMVANVYMPAVQRAVNDTFEETKAT